MSHGLGVMCATCREVIVPDTCPERDCSGRHGHSLQEPSAWAARIWPDHPCFAADQSVPAALVPNSQPDRDVHQGQRHADHQHQDHDLGRADLTEHPDTVDDGGVS